MASGTEKHRSNILKNTTQHACPFQRSDKEYQQHFCSAIHYSFIIRTPKYSPYQAESATRRQLGCHVQITASLQTQIYHKDFTDSPQLTQVLVSCVPLNCYTLPLEQLSRIVRGYLHVSSLHCKLVKILSYSSLISQCIIHRSP